MEVKIIDHNYKCIALIDTFTSLIWTERYNAPGDFELECPLNADAVNWVNNGCFAEIDESDYSMIIEEVNLESDYESGQTMTLKGRTLESILDRRTLVSFSTNGGRLPNILEFMFRRTVLNVLGKSGKLQTIPEFNYIMPTEETIPGVTSVQISGDFGGKTLLEAIQDAFAGTGLGFSMKRYVSENSSGVTAMHYNFEVVQGADRSIGQNIRPKVIFASEFDNMINSVYNKSNSLYKNAAYIIGDSNENGQRTLLYIPGLDWSYGTTYAVNDVVRFEDDELFYKCIREHTASDTNYPKSVSTYWSLIDVDDIIDSIVSGLNLRILKVDANDIPMMEEIEYPAWSSGTRYVIGDVVIDGPEDEEMYFKCTKTHNNSQVPPTGTNGMWTIGKSYAVNNIVYDDADDKLYRCKAAINQSQTHPGEDTTHWENIASNWISDDPPIEREIPVHTYNKYLAQRGLEELYSANSEVETYSGEAEPIGTFEYGRDFGIGDIVTIVNDFGMAINTRVTEVIRSEDQNGVTVVPTFSA